MSCSALLACCHGASGRALPGISHDPRCVWQAAQAAQRAREESGRVFGVLLESEASLLGLTNPSIDALTFYEGSPPLLELQERLDLVVTANPWLAGRLRGSLGAVQIWVPDVRSRTFAREARRQSRLVAARRFEAEEQAFVDAISEWNSE